MNKIHFFFLCYKYNKKIQKLVKRITGKLWYDVFLTIGTNKGFFDD